MPEKPSTLPQWATDADRTLEPASGEKDVGWEVGKRPAARKLNWLFNTLYTWIQYLNAPVGTDAGAGLAAEGGDTSGPGFHGTGGGPDGQGLRGTGTGAGAGSHNTGGATGHGTHGVGGATSGNGVRAQSGSAASAALHAVPQATPGTPAQGDIYDNSTTGKLEVYDGSRWDRYIPQAFVNATRPSISDVSGWNLFSEYITIPANKLRVGSTIRVRATVIASTTNSTNTVQMSISCNTSGGAAFPIVSTGAWDSTAGQIAHFDLTFIVLSATEWMITGVVVYGATATQVFQSTTTTNVDNTVAQDFGIAVQWSAAHAANSAQLHALCIDIT